MLSSMDAMSFSSQVTPKKASYTATCSAGVMSSQSDSSRPFSASRLAHSALMESLNFSSSLSSCDEAKISAAGV